MDNMRPLTLTEAARHAYLAVSTCELPNSSCDVEAWVPAMKAVSRLNATATHPALVAIADQLEAGFHDAIGASDPVRLHAAFDSAARRLRCHTDVR